MNDRLYGLGYLRLSDALKVEACNAGLFVSPAQGIHHGRVIDSYELILARTGTLVLSEETTVFALEQGDTLILWPGTFSSWCRALRPEYLVLLGAFFPSRLTRPIQASKGP